MLKKIKNNKKRHVTKAFFSLLKNSLLMEHNNYVILDDFDSTLDYSTLNCDQVGQSKINHI